MNREEKFLNELKQAVLDNLENEQFSVEHLSQIVGVSRSHLHRRLKKLKGQSISQFIREIRLTEALQLLNQDVATTSEIAYRVGFNSPSYFHKCFLEYYGYPPSEAKQVFQHQSNNKDLKRLMGLLEEVDAVEENAFDIKLLEKISGTVRKSSDSRTLYHSLTSFSPYCIW